MALPYGPPGPNFDHEPHPGHLPCSNPFPASGKRFSLVNRSCPDLYVSTSIGGLLSSPWLFPSSCPLFQAARESVLELRSLWMGPRSPARWEINQV